MTVFTSNAFRPAPESRALPRFTDSLEERVHVRQRLAAALRLFAHFDFDEGFSGHMSARDPVEPDTAWMNPFTMHFGQVRASDLIRVAADGTVLEGNWTVNTSAALVHFAIFERRPDVRAIAHAHTIAGKAMASLARVPAAITQDACAFFEDCALDDEYNGLILEVAEGERIADALGGRKAAVLANHGLLTVGESVDSCAWWMVSLDRQCRVELMARAAGSPREIPADVARQARSQNGLDLIGWLRFQALFDQIVGVDPGVLE